MDRRDGDRSRPLRTPAMAGGLFAIDRDYFYEVNIYIFRKKITILKEKPMVFINVFLVYVT